MEPVDHPADSFAQGPMLAPRLRAEPEERPARQAWAYGSAGAIGAVLGPPVTVLTTFLCCFGDVCCFGDHTPEFATFTALGLTGTAAGPPMLLAAGTVGRDFARDLGEDPGNRDLSIAWTLYGVSLTGWSVVALGTARDDITLVSTGLIAAGVGHYGLVPFGISQLHRNRKASYETDPRYSSLRAPRFDVHLTPWASASRPGATLLVRW